MPTVQKHFFQVWDEYGKEVDSLPSKNDLVVLSLKGDSFRDRGPVGLFQGIEENADDGHANFSHTDVILKIADRINNYEMSYRLETKVHRCPVENIKLIRLLARNSSAAATLFKLIGEARAHNADLSTKITKAVQALDVITEGGKVIIR
ncbi:MAG: hypothetical protein Greene071421_529 [Parcubacteria group bacterium Greene0714_21]|nr:MAG: hypothetical protein Greene041639_483 [Parcubacteria group bacterium Greene0416_39]TSC97886.1 MAG: hypothetical protein Greene101447_269 [Parcubacteria group bacterium Greene1014_47]TSD03917.1 MAG: hypothetical protein Greene071421_529 [Parcubacteria group bacterium Greene0714_21]